MAAQQDGQRAPDEQGHHHERGDLHDAQRLATGFVKALDIHPPEVDGDQGGEESREMVHVEGEGLTEHLGDFVQQVSEIRARGNDADGAGKDVIED